MDISKPVVHGYSFTLTLPLPITNNFNPSSLNARPVGPVSCPDTSKVETPTVVQVDISKPTVHGYSFTLSLLTPITNNFNPSSLNARPVGIGSSNWTRNTSTKVVAADASLIGANPMEQIMAKNTRNLILEYFIVIWFSKIIQYNAKLGFGLSFKMQITSKIAHT